MKNFSEKINIILYSFGTFTTLLGSSIYTFAISLFVLKLTSSGISFATTLAIGVLPTILIGPFAGVIADKLNKKTVIIFSDIASSLIFIFLFYYSTNFSLNLKIIYFTTFMVSAISSIFNITISSSKPNIVHKKNLMLINSIEQIISSSSLIFAPLIGGLIFTIVDINFFILINSISFIISAFSEFFINFNLNKIDFSEENIPKNLSKFSKNNILDEIKNGILYLKSREDLKKIIKIFIFLNFIFGYSVIATIPYIINNTLNLSTNYFGIIQSFMPLGMIFGALFVKKLFKNLSYIKFLNNLISIFSFFLIIIAVSLIFKKYIHNPLIYLLFYSFIMFFLGILISLIDIPFSYILQDTVPENYRGRVISISLSIIKIVFPFAIMLSGILLNITNSYVIPLSGGILLILIKFYIHFIYIKS